MRMFVLLVGFFLFSLSCFAGGDPLSVRLRIVDAISGEALVGAHVLVHGADFEFFSDPDGYVILDPSLTIGLADLTLEYISYQDASIKLALKPGLTVLAMNPR